MSLVAYGSSDSSEEDNDCVEKLSNNNAKISHQALQKKRETVKIAIPSLKEFKDEESDANPKKKFVSQGGSGLFSILPPPKNSNILSKPGFIPYVFSKKQDAKKDSKTSVKTTTPAITKSEKDFLCETHEEHENYECDNVESTKDEVTACDFFSLSKSEISEISTDTCFNEELQESPEPTTSQSFPLRENDSPQTSSKLHQQSDCLNYEFRNDDNAILNNTPIVENNDPELPFQESPLNEEALKMLQGRRREFENINLIDVKVDDQLTDRNEWLMKSLTQEAEHRPSKRRHDMPTSQQKRKHQITYLAFQAKEREMDLKNQWALNSRTRRETQAKYGF